MKYLASIFMFLSFSTGAFSQNQGKESSQIKIDVCQPEITEAGRQSSFQFSYSYRVLSNADGSVKDVKELSDHKKYQYLMNDEKVIPCIEKWNLKSSERYLVIINVGTTATEKSLNILSKTVKIKLLL